MLSANSKAQRHELRCAAMRERKELARTKANRERVRKNKRNYEARERLKRGLPPIIHRSPKEIRQREENGCARMKRYLARQAKEMAEERYFTAVYGIKSSWAAVERAGIYRIWRRRDDVRTRQCLSVRPAKLWLNSALPPITSIDRHDLGRHLEAPRKAA